MVEPQTQNKKYSKLAVASFVSSIILFLLLIFAYIKIVADIHEYDSQIPSLFSLLIIPVLFILLCISLIVGLFVLRNIKKNPALKGHALVWVSIIISAIPVIIIILLTLLNLFPESDNKKINPDDLCEYLGGVCTDEFCNDQVQYNNQLITCSNSNPCCHTAKFRID